MNPDILRARSFIRRHTSDGYKFTFTLKRYSHGHTIMLNFAEYNPRVSNKVSPIYMLSEDNIQEIHDTLLGLKLLSI